MAGRLSGKNGAIWMGGSLTKLVDSFSWEFEETQEVLPCSIKGEAFERYAAAVASGRVRIESFVQNTSPLTSQMNAALVTSAGVGTVVAFNLWGIIGANAGVGTPPEVIGTGYLIRSRIRVARDAIIIDELEIQVDGALTTVA